MFVESCVFNDSLSISLSLSLPHVSLSFALPQTAVPGDDWGSKLSASTSKPSARLHQERGPDGLWTCPHREYLYLSFLHYYNIATHISANI